MLFGSREESITGNGLSFSRSLILALRFIIATEAAAVVIFGSTEFGNRTGVMRDSPILRNRNT